ncbi:hypothetical protein [Halobacillus kuroshimensis]|uniref:hypothetical protein n=1 Tax=Halobacillus kuroshimensis TaxID=302481 RepID=UPI000484D670|nr:hypothetical protein [Halobacillus kuroshimensis]
MLIPFSKKETPFKVREYKLGVSASYIFYGKYDVPLYVGSTICFRKRMYNHFSSTTFMDEVERIEIIETKYPNYLEMYLIGKLNPLYNKRIVSHKEPYSLKRED